MLRSQFRFCSLRKTHYLATLQRLQFSRELSLISGIQARLSDFFN